MHLPHVPFLRYLKLPYTLILRNTGKDFFFYFKKQCNVEERSLVHSQGGFNLYSLLHLFLFFFKQKKEAFDSRLFSSMFNYMFLYIASYMFLYSLVYMFLYSLIFKVIFTFWLYQQICKEFMSTLKSSKKTSRVPTWEVWHTVVT